MTGWTRNLSEESDIDSGPENEDGNYSEPLRFDTQPNIDSNEPTSESKPQVSDTQDDVDESSKPEGDDINPKAPEIPDCGGEIKTSAVVENNWVVEND